MLNLSRLDITDPDDMDEAELILLEQLSEDILINHLPQQILTIKEIKNWHYRWLGNIYEWAGEERSVNLSKDGFQFAAAPQVAKLLTQFEEGYLNKYTPCTDYTDEQLIEAIAITHIEFILIHPFREGNGRLSRLLANVMAIQAGYQPLDYSYWDTNKKTYFAAIQAGVAMNYKSLKNLFSGMIVK